MPILPFKLNQDRRRHIPRQRHRVTNSLGALLRSRPAYDASLRQRGSLTVWFTDDAIAGWAAEPCTTRGGQPLSASLTLLRGIATRWYSSLAILTALTLRAVFRLAYRQAEGLLGSVIGLLGLALPVPDHTTLSRRAATLEVPRPGNADAGAGSEPMHLLVDSTGLKLCGKGEWLLEKHGTATRRSWRALHLGVDAGTGRIVTSTLTAKDLDDASQAGPLLDQIAGAVASFTGDGAYDQDRVYAGVAERHSEAAVVVPPRASAVPSDTAETAPTLLFQPLCGRNLEQLRPRSGTATCNASPSTGAWRGRTPLDTTSAPGSRPPWADGNRSSATSCARTRMSAGRPRWRSPSTRSTACWISDARATSASPDPRRGWGQCARTPDPCTTLAHAVIRTQKTFEASPDALLPT